MKRILLLFILMPFCVFADHYFGGYINYAHVSGFTYHVEVITYSDSDDDKDDSDRDSVQIKWGDGSENWITRTNTNGKKIYPGVKKNIYEGVHTFSKEGNYQLIFQDSYRMFDVTNMSPGKSGTSVLYVDAIIAVRDTLSYCVNNSAKTLYDPYMWVHSGDPFLMNLTHYDKEGDSLSFKLVKPKALNGAPVVGYWEPSGVSLDPETGYFKWDNPTWGIFIFAYEISEFRDGIQIGYSIVDFPIFVNNNYEYERGDFTSVENTIAGVYDFNGAGSEYFMVSYENSLADSVGIEVEGGYKKSLYFTGTEHKSTEGNKAFDTLSLNYLGNDKQQGGHVITFRASSYFDADTVFDFLSILVNTESDTTWGCIVPPSIKEVEEVSPDIPVLTLSPSLFTDDVWINLGTSFKDMKIEIFDIRGRLAYEESNIDSQTMRFNLGSLNIGMYLFRVWRNQEVLTVLKAVKR